jgi:hypothetical protein
MSVYSPFLRLLLLAPTPLFPAFCRGRSFCAEMRAQPIVQALPFLGAHWGRGTAEYPIPPWRAEARSEETVKDSDNGATAPAARSVLYRLESGGQFAKRGFGVESVPNSAHCILLWLLCQKLLREYACAPCPLETRRISILPSYCPFHGVWRTWLGSDGQHRCRDS